MKTLSLGDTHGRNYWKKIIQGDEDLIIFSEINEWSYTYCDILQHTIEGYILNL
jgi:hypothetical protein